MISAELPKDFFTRYGIYKKNTNKGEKVKRLVEMIQGVQCKLTVDNPIRFTWTTKLLATSNQTQVEVMSSISTLDNMHELTKQTQSPKRQRKSPITKRKDFLWM